MLPDEYKQFIELAKKRRSCRSFRADPLPEEYIKAILEAGRWAMSGANSQPWEFMVIKDEKIREELFTAYRDIDCIYTFWMEQQRVFDYRHNAQKVKGSEKEVLEERKSRPLWRDAPVIIAILGDGRRQWGTIMGGHTMGRGQTHLTDGLANACQMMHLAAASLGLGSEWVSIHVEEPFKRILKVPDLLALPMIIPLGYRKGKEVTGWRRELDEIVHYDQYDESKYMQNQDFLKYLRRLRGSTDPMYKYE